MATIAFDPLSGLQQLIPARVFANNHLSQILG